MCDPVSLTIAAAAAVSATGSIVNGSQQAAMMNYQAKVADRNAQLENEAARDAQERTRLNAQLQYRKSAQLAGQQNAAMAANGIDLGFGSAATVQKDTAMIGAEDIAQIYKGGFEDARGYEINAANARSEAQGKRMGESNAMTSAYFGAASSLLGGANQYARYQGGKGK